MSPSDFSFILTKIKPYTNYIYLHVLGEPLLHPDLTTLLAIADENGFFVNITTNGSLIEKKKDVLMNHPIRQFNISLHDAEENVIPAERKKYLTAICEFAKNKSKDSYFSLRFWNEGSATSEAFNRECISFINEYFNTDITFPLADKEINKKIADHVFIQTAKRFSWPGEKVLGIKNRTCYALKDHIAILADGTIVPCCLDANGEMVLGNILNEDLESILTGEKARQILCDFQNRKISEKICMDCGFLLL